MKEECLKLSKKDKINFRDLTANFILIYKMSMV